MQPKIRLYVRVTSFPPLSFTVVFSNPFLEDPSVRWDNILEKKYSDGCDKVEFRKIGGIIKGKKWKKVKVLCDQIFLHSCLAIVFIVAWKITQEFVRRQAIHLFVFFYVVDRRLLLYVRSRLFVKIEIAKIILLCMTGSGDGRWPKPVI